MAMLCFRPPPTPSPPETHGRYHTTRDVLFLPFRTKKVALLSRKVDVSFEKSLLLSTVDSKYSKGGIIKISWLSESLANWKFSGFWLLISDYQQSTPASFRKAFVLANTLMFFMPLNVLAETCEADNSFLNMPLLFGIALIGAAVGGNLARQRRGELKRLNDQLRQINAALRRQAKIESYAPNLSYAPVGRTPEVEVVVDPRKHQLITNLRTGKNFLRNQDLEKAFSEFKAALELAQDLGDYVEEKKAARGLGASLQRQGKYKDAIKYHSRVLEISQHVGEDSGTTEAYGAIADCYTELGDLERAGKFYDKYIARLESD